MLLVVWLVLLGVERWSVRVAVKVREVMKSQQVSV